MRALGWIAALALGAWGVHGSAMAQSDSKNSEASGAKAGAAAEQGASDAALAQIDQFIAEQKINRSAADWKRKGVKQPPKLSFSAGKNYFWELETNVGNLVFRLLPDVAPQHVSSTIYLTRLGFYDDVVFHRVIDGFMAQGGDPTGSGSGGPGYEYNGEFDPKVKHDKPGLLSMANAGPGTDGSQFFITFVPTPHLDGKHTIFGELRAGKETLTALEKRGSRSGKPSEPLKIVTAKIRVE
jgi:peptidyl-prolyl cis-trans isomerase B (cyclophilin B)